MKKLLFLLLALSCTAAFAQTQSPPRIAVYVTGDVTENEKKTLGTRMLASLVNSGRYRGIERSNSFLAEIDREQAKQRSGAIDDGQISELGRQFGVKYVCIADITPAFGGYHVSARIIDVETAEVEFIGDSASPLKTMDDLTEVSDKVVDNMFGGTVRHAPEPKPVTIPQKTESVKKPLKQSFYIGLGAEAIGVGIIAYGLYENGNAISLTDDRRFSKAEKSTKNRDAAYIVGAALILSGISIQIFF